MDRRIFIRDALISIVGIAVVPITNIVAKVTNKH
jgi:hypothetical protein